MSNAWSTRADRQDAVRTVFSPIQLTILMENYLQTRQKLVQEAQNLDIFDSVERFGQFSFFSANLANFIPLYDAGQHVSAFREAFLNQRLSLLDDQYFATGVPMPIHGWDEAITGPLNAHPGIICTLHAGSYRILSYLLTLSRIPFAILMSAKTAKDQGPSFRRRYADWHHRRGEAAELPIVEAEDPRAMWQIVRLLRSGHQLLFYLDGFSGLSTDMEANLQRLPFLAQHLYARKGAALLAQKARVPIYPINNVRQKDGSLLVIADQPIQPLDMPSASFATYALTKVFAFFGSQIMHAPAQWENWFFVHFQVDSEGLLQPHPLKMQAVQPNVEKLPEMTDYGIYRHERGYYLLEKKGYKSYRMNKTDFVTLWSYWRKKEQG